MGDVAVHLKVMPASPEVDLEKVKAELLAKGAKQVDVKPVAFGLKLLDVLFVVPDEKGSKLEEEISEIDGVGSVETESVTLV